MSVGDRTVKCGVRLGPFEEGPCFRNITLNIFIVRFLYVVYGHRNNT